MFQKPLWPTITLCLYIIIDQVAHVTGVIKILASDDESRLAKDLFQNKGYNNLIRPVANISQSVLVEFNMAMIQLINLEEKSQVMKTNVWLRQQWNDYQLQWDPANYGGIKILRTSSSKIWSPELVLFNNADGNYEVSWSPNVLITFDGTVMWIPPAIYKSTCTIDVQYFPFDQQTCEMRFGSWTYDGTQVSLKWMDRKNYMDLGDYFKSGTWDIIKCPGYIQYNNDTEHGKQPVEIVYKITLRRKTLFYTVNLIIPCVLISFLSFCVFYLPSDVGEKITLCISILLALVVFLLLISKILPPTSISIPLISKYLIFTFVMNIVTILITVAIINCNFRTPRTHYMPDWVRTVFINILPNFLFMRRPGIVEQEFETRKRLQSIMVQQQQETYLSQNSHYNSATIHLPIKKQAQKYSSQKLWNTTQDELSGDFEMMTVPSSIDHSMSLIHHHPNCSEVLRHKQSSSLLSAPSNQLTIKMKDDLIEWDNEVETCSHPKSFVDVPILDSTKPFKFRGIEITQEIREALSAINFIATHLENTNNFQQVMKDWKYVAAVIDRLLLFIFGLITVVGTIAILISTPFIYSSVIDIEDLKLMYDASSSISEKLESQI